MSRSAAAGKTTHSQTDSVERKQMPNFFRVNQTLSSHDYLVFLIKASLVPRIASGTEKWINRYGENKHTDTSLRSLVTFLR